MKDFKIKPAMLAVAFALGIFLGALIVSTVYTATNGLPHPVCDRGGALGSYNSKPVCILDAYPPRNVISP